MNYPVRVDPWLTVAAAAERVHRSKQTIYRWISDGEVTMLAGRVRESEVVSADRKIRRRRKQGKTRAIPVTVAGARVGMVQYNEGTGRITGTVEPGLTATRAELS